MAKIKNKKNNYPEAIVGALIIREDGKMLFGKSVKWNGLYTVFGGHIEYGEKARDAIVREVKEETGLDVKILAQFDFSESIFSKDFYNERHFIFLDFLCQCGSKGEVKLNEEFENDFVWVKFEEARKMNLAGGTKDMLKKYLEYNKIYKTRSKIKRVKQKNGRTKKR